MRVLVTGRRMGKTTKMVETLKANPDKRLLVFNEHEKRRLVYEFKLKPEQIVTVADLQSDRRRGGGARGPIPLAVDNAEMILQAMLPSEWRIEELAITGERIS